MISATSFSAAVLGRLRPGLASRSVHHGRRLYRRRSTVLSPRELHREISLAGNRFKRHADPDI